MTGSSNHPGRKSVRRDRLIVGFLALSGALACLCLFAGRAYAEYFPPPDSQGGWRRAAQKNQVPTAAEIQKIKLLTGLDWSKLEEAWILSNTYASGKNLGSFLVIRNGYIGGEWGANESLDVASCAKSLTSLAMARLFDQSELGHLAGSIGPEDPVHSFLPPEWLGLDGTVKRSILVRHLMTMSSGLSLHDSPRCSDNEPHGSSYYYTVSQEPAPYPFVAEAIRMLPGIKPGQVWNYGSLQVDLLGLALKRVTGQKIGDYFWNEIGNEIGLDPSTTKWSDFGSGGKPGQHHLGSAYVKITATDLARVAYLLLKGGRWKDPGGVRQIIRRERVETHTRWAESLEKAAFGEQLPFAATDPGAPSRYSWLFWTNRTKDEKRVGPGVPADAFYMNGYRVQFCVVIPSLDMVIVRQMPDGPEPWSDALFAGVMGRIMEAVDPVYIPNLPPVVKLEPGPGRFGAGDPLKIWVGDPNGLFGELTAVDILLDIDGINIQIPLNWWDFPGTLQDKFVDTNKDGVLELLLAWPGFGRIFNSPLIKELGGLAVTVKAKDSAGHVTQVGPFAWRPVNP